MEGLQLGGRDVTELQVAAHLRPNSSKCERLIKTQHSTISLISEHRSVPTPPDRRVSLITSVPAASAVYDQQAERRSGDSHWF